MNKLEFGDINKFLSSLGLISIGLAFLFPWFVNQNNTFLTLEQEKINKLTPTAQKIILNQQNQLLEINSRIFIIFISLIALGTILLIIGIYRWWNRQNVIDEIQNEDLKAKRILNISEEEKRKLIANEIANSDEKVDNEISEPSGIKISENRIEKYISIENKIYTQLKEKFKTNFTANQNVRINNIYYDIVFKSKDLQIYKDRIVEIKYFDNFLDYDKIKIYADKLIASTQDYERLFKRKSLSILIIVYSQNEYSETISKYKKDIEEYTKKLGRILKIVLIKDAELIEGKELTFK